MVTTLNTLYCFLGVEYKELETKTAEISQHHKQSEEDLMSGPGIKWRKVKSWCRVKRKKDEEEANRIFIFKR